MAMDSKLSLNLNKIETLQASYYEKDIIRSAFYNHLNNIPISKDSLKVLQKYKVTFFKRDIIVGSNINIQERKKQYKRTYQPNYSKNSQPKSPNNSPSSNAETKVYKRDYISNTHSNAIMTLLQKANLARAEAQKFLETSQEILQVCFQPSELSHGMIKNLIESITDSLQKKYVALDNFLMPFLDTFVGLQTEAKQEIMQKAQNLLNQIQELQNISVNLCIKLSAIRASSTLKKDDGLNAYVSDTIEKMELYLK